MTSLPLARSADLVLQEFDQELLVYDLRINKAYCLNETAKIIFEACNGATTFDEVRSKYHLPDEIIFLALDKLKQENLLTAGYQSAFTGMKRREVIKSLGLTSFALLPLISSVVAPSPIQAQSVVCVNPGGIPPGSQEVFNQTCGTPCVDCPCATAFCNSQCCSGMAVLSQDNGARTLCMC